MSLSPLVIWAGITTAVAMYAVVSMLFKKDTAIEERRRNAMQCCSMLREIGLDDYADVMENYVVGDYSGLAKDIRRMGKNALNPEKTKEALRRNFFAQLPNRLTDPEERVKIQKLINESIARDSVKTEVIER